MNKSIKSLTIFAFGLIILSHGNSIFAQDTIKWVKIGNKIWMTENLNVDRFRNGDLIHEVKTNDKWKSAGEHGRDAFCYYDNDVENGKKYGKLYNWHTVIDERGLVPIGWHIPTKAEFQKLEETIKGDGNALKEVGQGIGLGIGTNNSGFTALLVGSRDDDGYFWGMNSLAKFWSSTEYRSKDAFSIALDEDKNYVSFTFDNKTYGLSVRCIKD